MLAVALVGVVAGSVGCKDYDDDIDQLNGRVDTLTATVEQLRALIDGGAVITNVQKGADGIVITLSDNSTYTLTNGQNGTNGTNGKDAAVWTIGEDGFWYKDGAKTEYKAIGTDGKDGVNGTDGKDGVNGTDGKDGVNGTDGKNGKYYVPNTETGNFDIYQDGEFVEATDISWKATGVTATYSGNTLTLSNVDGYEGDVVIELGPQLGSVGFVPGRVHPDFTTYPTTTEPFYHLVSYISEEKYDMNGVFIPQTTLNTGRVWDKSNVVDFVYRLNPSDAYVEGAHVAFVDRVVKVATRAADDAAKLLNVVASDFETTKGEVTVKGTVNASALAVAAKHNNVAALQVWEGQDPVTSDYTYVTSEAIEPVLANTEETEVGSVAARFYDRTKSLKSSKKGEDDTFVKQFVGNVDAKDAHFVLPYNGGNGSLDLKPLVALYSDDIHNYLAAVGFEGITYVFSKPKEYLADDNKKTNQQAYIDVNEETGVVTLSKDYATSAIGRKPIVRVDASIKDNVGNEELIASAYIKLEVTPGTAVGDHNIKINEDQNVDYRTIDTETLIGDMDWSAVSKEIYDAENLTAKTFWDSYMKTYNVKITIDGVKDPIFDKDVPYDTEFTTKAEGVLVQINLNSADEQSAYVKVLANNTIKTDHTYKNGAVYTVEITILPNDKRVHGQFVLTQKFTVKDSHPHYPFNPLYHFDKSSKEYGSIEGITSDDIIVVKGRVENNLGSESWKMSSLVSEHFERLENPDDKGTFVDIFTYYNQNKYFKDNTETNAKNVEALTFDWTWTPTYPTDVMPQELQTAPFDFFVALKEAIKTPYLVRNMTLTQTLVNGEECLSNYDILFVNPFVAGDAKGVSIQGNDVGEQTVDVKPQVLVEDKVKSKIYSYNSTSKALKLSDKATDTYKIDPNKVKVTYAFKEDAAYTAFMSQLTKDSKFVISSDANGDANLGGVITWNNEGASLEHDVKLTVIATVTFEDLSVVECEIPVTLVANMAIN